MFVQPNQELNVRYVIASRARTGTTMLYHMLAGHRGVCSHGEVFTWDPDIMEGFVGLQKGGYFPNARRVPAIVTDMINERNADPVRFLEQRIFRNHGNFRAVGLKLKFEEMELDRYRELAWYIRDHADIRVIMLQRKNVLRRYISEQISHRVYNKVFNVLNKEQKPEKQAIDLDYDELLQEFEYNDQLYDKYERMFERNPMLDLSYERLAADPHECATDVMDFLNLEHLPLKIRTQRLHANPVSELLSNYDELLEKFRGTRYEHFFLD